MSQLLIDSCHLRLTTFTLPLALENLSLSTFQSFQQVGLQLFTTKINFLLFLSLLLCSPLPVIQGKEERKIDQLPQQSSPHLISVIFMHQGNSYSFKGLGWLVHSRNSFDRICALQWLTNFAAQQNHLACFVAILGAKLHPIPITSEYQGARQISVVLNDPRSNDVWEPLIQSLDNQNVV